jgi:phage gp16-like protein
MGNASCGRDSTRLSMARISKSDIKYIQRLRHAIGIDDDTYDAMKKSIGVGSTKELNHLQFVELLRRIKGAHARQADPGSAGIWKPMHKSAKQSGMHRQPPPEKEGMIRKIEAMLTERALPWGYADAIARRMFGVEKLLWCDAEKTYKVLQALAVQQRRAAKKTEANANEANAKEGPC